MTSHNGWYEYWSEFVDYCLLDTTLLRDIDKKLNAIDFFVATQQLWCLVGEHTKVTRYFRGLVGRRTDKKAKSAINNRREQLTAAHIPTPYGSSRRQPLWTMLLYPNIILSDNLSYETSVTNLQRLPRHWAMARTGVKRRRVYSLLS